VPKRLSIDAERFLVLGEETTLEQPHPALPRPIHIEQRTRYSHLDWNTRPPDSRFVFRAPASAARAEKLAGEPTEEASAWIGKPAPEFALADLEGTRRPLAAHRGKVVLLDFWATWCGPCRREMPIIQQLHERYGKKGLVVYGVNCSEPASRAKTFMNKYGYRFPTLLDRNGEVQGSFQVTAIPTVFVVDRNGLIRAHLIGGRSESELVAALEGAGLDTGP
jgi:DsbE subfamily thiol:disulfide oxidoreductase